MFISYRILVTNRLQSASESSDTTAFYTSLLTYASVHRQYDYLAMH